MQKLPALAPGLRGRIPGKSGEDVGINFAATDVT
jgi:hypothetical protein